MSKRNNKGNNMPGNNTPAEQPVTPVTPVPPVEAPVTTDPVITDPVVTEPVVQTEVASAAPEAQPPAATAPVAPPVAAPTEPQTVEEYIQARHKITAPLSAMCTRCIDMVKEYAEVMDPFVPNTPETGGAQQGKFFVAIVESLSLKNGEHRIALDAISWLICKHRATVFSDKRVMRFMSTIRLNSKDVDLFKRLIVLVVNCANLRTRRTELTKIDIRRITSLLSPELQTTLLDYYNPR